MEPVIIDYLEKFEEKIRLHLLKLCTERGVLDGKLLESEDIREYWLRIEPNYIADAAAQVAQYPTVSVAWAFYLGMAVAYCWDMDWNTYQHTKYEDFYGDEGFDNMDDHIVCDILGIVADSEEAKSLVAMIQTLAQDTVSMIRHEQIEPQSPMAYYVFTRACAAMFSIGAAVELKKLGYDYHKLG